MWRLRILRQWLWGLTCTGLSTGAHITRYSMYRRLAEVGQRLPSKSGRILAISRSRPICGYMGIEGEFVDADYPQANMSDLQFPNESFDFVASDQVLEHLEGDPYAAIRECKRVLRPGGVAIHTTCFINPVHLDPGDFWRFTPDALKMLHADWSEVIEFGGWGNFGVWSWVHAGCRWLPVPHATWHPLHRAATYNDPEWPIVTWVVARK